MQSEPLDTEVMRLIAYVKPVLISDGDDEDYENYEDDEDVLEASDEDETIPDEYLIDFMTVGEAKEIGSDGLLNRIASVLIDKKVISLSTEPSHVTWRLVRDGDLTPTEKATQQLNEIYQVRDLRHLHWKEV